MEFARFLFCLLLLAATTVFAPRVSADDKIIFIVNSENSVTELPAKTIADFYFKKKRQWADGSSVRFIDKAATSPARRIFLSQILGQSAEDVELFWIGQKLYSGDSAPLQENSDTMTIQFVSSFKGAIGYLAAPLAASAKGVKVIKVKDLIEKE